MKTTRFYQIIIALLIVINIVTISIPFFGKPPRPEHNGLIKKIGLTGENGKIVSKLETQHHKDKRALLKTRGDFYLSLYENVEDDSRNIKLLDSINDVNSKIDKMTYIFFKDVAEFCNEDQKQELKKMIHHLFMKVGNKGPL